MSTLTIMVVCVIATCLWFDVGANATSHMWLEWVGPDAVTATVIHEPETNTRDYAIVWEEREPPPCPAFD